MSIDRLILPCLCAVVFRCVLIRLFYIPRSELTIEKTVPEMWLISHGFPSKTMPDSAVAPEG